LQEKASGKLLKKRWRKAAGLDLTNGALVAMDPKTGQILAMVGSKDYFEHRE